MAACGWDFTVAVTEDGELFAWGDGRDGHLGLGTVLHQQQPARALQHSSLCKSFSRLLPMFLLVQHRQLQL